VTADETAARGVAHGTPFARAALGPGMPGTGPFRILDDSGALLAVYRADGNRAVPEVVIA
jgi:hypothetical protein